MKLPSLDWIVGYFATAVSLGGFGFGVARWHRLERGQRLIALWLGASALSDLLSYIVAPVWGNAQPIARMWFLTNVLLGVGALAAYNRRWQFTLRLVSAGYLVAWLFLAATIEPLDHYSTWSGPLQGIVLLGAATTTLFRRVSLGRRDLLADPGFLIAAALAAVAIPAAFETVVAQFWLHGHRERVTAYYAMNDAVSAFADLVIISALRLPYARTIGLAA